MLLTWVHRAPKFSYSCYNPKRINLPPSITSSILGFLEIIFDQPSSNTETNPHPVSKQAGGKHIKSWFFLYDFPTILVPVLSPWNCCCDWGFPEISRSWPLSTAFFSCRHRKIDEKWFDHGTLQVALDQICRMGAKYAAGCINFLEN